MNLFDLDLFEPADKPKKAKAYETQIQDKFEPEYKDRDCRELTDAEIFAERSCVLFCDVECYPNYYLVEFKQAGKETCISLETTKSLSQEQRKKLEWLMSNFLIVGYNSNNYDIVMIQLAIAGKSVQQLYQVSTSIIIENAFVWSIRKRYKLDDHTYNHIDLIEVAPLRGSLKLYAGRLHADRMQDLPYDPTHPLTPDEMIVVKKYCINDLFSTELVFDELKPALELRYKMTATYGIDLRSKSDAQIAEYVIKSELYKRTGIKPEKPSIAVGTVFKYNVPEYLSYNNPALQDMLNIVRDAKFKVGESGYVDLPGEISRLNLCIGSCIYRMGIGGLHSTEQCVSYSADSSTLLIDRDVASYYPSIILNQALYPAHLGKQFLTVYKEIVKERLKAKKDGNSFVAAALKITINGSFGKLGSKFSALYAPDLMIQVTITGQLSLLMLIDMIEHAGIPVVSGNTDGVVIKCPNERYNDLQQIILKWETTTGFNTEESKYNNIYARDVNNYLSVKCDGKIKVKGCYAEKGSAGDSVLSKNPDCLISLDAIQAKITKGTPIADTVRTCNDIRRFVSVRNVTGGAIKSGVLLGKTIRWYYSTRMHGVINYRKNGNKVPDSDGAMPLMQLPTELPNDIDYERYISMANEMLYEVNYCKRPVDEGFLFKF